MNMNQYTRGQLDALHGKDRNYGCHFGLRSTKAVDEAQYQMGYNEVHYYLTNGDDMSFTARCHQLLECHGWKWSIDGWTRDGVVGFISINGLAGQGTWCHRYSPDESRINTNVAMFDTYLKDLDRVASKSVAVSETLELTQDYQDDSMTEWYVSHRVYGMVGRITKTTAAGRSMWIAQLDNDCIGFGDRKSFYSEKAPKLWIECFCEELAATGH